MPFKIKDLMISDLSGSAQKNGPPTCHPVTQLCTHVTCAACSVASIFRGCHAGTGFLCGERTTDTTCTACTAVTHGACTACTNITGGQWPTITCGACTAVTRGGCTACTNVTGGIWTDNTCGACTAVTRAECTFITCGFCTVQGDKARDTETSSAESLAALSILKEQLKQQLVEVEREQAAIEKSLLPQTVEQVDDLSRKLTEALQELKELKLELSGNAKPAEDK